MSSDSQGGVGPPTATPPITPIPTPPTAIPSNDASQTHTYTQAHTQNTNMAPNATPAMHMPHATPMAMSHLHPPPAPGGPLYLVDPSSSSSVGMGGMGMSMGMSMPPSSHPPYHPAHPMHTQSTYLNSGDYGHAHAQMVQMQQLQQQQQQHAMSELHRHDYHARAAYHIDPHTHNIIEQQIHQQQQHFHAHQLSQQQQQQQQQYASQMQFDHHQYQLQLQQHQHHQLQLHEQHKLYPPGDMYAPLPPSHPDMSIVVPLMQPPYPPPLPIPPTHTLTPNANTPTLARIHTDTVNNEHTIGRRPASNLPSPSAQYVSPRPSRYPTPLSSDVCLTSDHAVLTRSRGWTPIGCVTVSDEVWSLRGPIDVSGARLTMEWSRVNKTHRLTAPDTLIAIKGADINCIATHAHRWPVKGTTEHASKSSCRWVRTDELDSTMQLIAAGSNDNVDYQFITGDNFNPPHQSVLLPSIGACLRDLDSPCESALSSPGASWITASHLLDSINWIHRLSRRQARHILAAVARNASTLRVYSSRARDAIQLVGLMAGVTVSARRITIDEPNDEWSLHLGRTIVETDAPAAVTFLPLGSSSILPLPSHAYPDVFCLTVSNGNFYTRRHDDHHLCAVFTGNCKVRSEELYQPAQCYSPLTSKSFAFPGLYQTALTKLQLHYPHTATTTSANLYTRHAMTHQSHHLSHAHLPASTRRASSPATIAHDPPAALESESELYPAEEEEEPTTESHSADEANFMSDLLSAATGSGFNKSKPVKSRRRVDDDETPVKKKRKSVPTADAATSDPAISATHADRPLHAKRPKPLPLDDAAGRPSHAHTVASSTPVKKPKPNNQPTTPSAHTTPAPKPRQTRTSQLASNDVIEELAKSIAMANAEAKKKHHAALKIDSNSSSVASAMPVDGGDASRSAMPVTPHDDTLDGELGHSVVMTAAIKAESISDDAMAHQIDEPHEDETKAAVSHAHDELKDESAPLVPSEFTVVIDSPSLVPLKSDPAQPVSNRRSNPIVGPNGEILPTRGRGRPPKPKTNNNTATNTNQPTPPPKQASRPTSPNHALESKENSAPIDTSEPHTASAESTLPAVPHVGDAPTLPPAPPVMGDPLPPTSIPAAPASPSTAPAASVDPGESARQAELRRQEELNERYLAKYLHLYDQTQAFANSTSRTRHQANANATGSASAHTPINKKNGRKSLLHEKEFNPKSVIKQIRADIAAITANQSKITSPQSKPIATVDVRPIASTTSEAEPATDNDKPTHDNQTKPHAQTNTADNANDLAHQPTHDVGVSDDDAPVSHDDADDVSSSDGLDSKQSVGVDSRSKAKRLSELDRLHQLNQGVFHQEELARQKQLRKQKRAAAAEKRAHTPKKR